MNDMVHALLWFVDEFNPVRSDMAQDVLPRILEQKFGLSGLTIDWLIERGFQI
jgi:hypothetical protein